VDGKRIISEAAMAEMHKPSMVLKYVMDIPHKETTMPSYGMGWFVECYRGHTLVEHGGNLDGFSAWTSFMPELNLGVVAYTNMNVSALHTALAREVYDYYIGAESGNWVKRYYDHYVKQSQARSDGMKRFTGERVEGTVHSRPLEAYTGTYTRPGYSPVTVRLENGSLYMKFIDADTQLKHFHYDVFTTSDLMGGGEIAPGLPVQFRTADFRGEIDTLTMPLCFEDGAAPIRFKKEIQKT
jgi:hypothetical protein